MNITLVVFGNKPWENALKRIYNQAKDTQLFNNLFILNEESLDKETDFIKSNHDFINSGVPGYGAWTWKPYIIEKAFKKFPSSDFFMYLDSGSELNIKNSTRGRFFEYVDIADNDSIFGFRNRDQEANLSHCSIIDKIYKAGKHTLQFEANTLIMKNNDMSLNIIKEWKRQVIENGYENVVPKDIYKCCDLFGHHLHDQSVLSCLLKKEKVEGINDEASWYLPSYSVDKDININKNKYPIFTARNPFERSLLDKSCIRYKEFSTCLHNSMQYDCDETVVVR